MIKVHLHCINSAYEFLEEQAHIYNNNINQQQKQKQIEKRSALNTSNGNL